MTKKRTKKGDDPSLEELRIHGLATQAQGLLRELGIKKALLARKDAVLREMAALDTGDIKGLISLQAQLKCLDEYYSDLCYVVVGNKMKQPEKDKEETKDV